jgi:hypothetical protein
MDSERRVPNTETRGSKGISGREAKIRSSALIVCLAVCILAWTPCAPGGTVQAKDKSFQFKKVGTRYEPEVHSDVLVFKLPGTEMTFAAYTCIPPGDDIGAKYGFFLDDGRFFYVDEVDASDGEAQYALAGDYFVVDGYAFASTGHGRTMYLFRHGRDWVDLLDMIGDRFTAHYGFEFKSDYPGKPAYGEEITMNYEHTPVWAINERDNRGNPLIKIRLYPDPSSYELYEFYTSRGIDADEYEKFHLYLKIEVLGNGMRSKTGAVQVAARLQVARDPEIYRPLFDKVRNVQKDGIRPAAYYVYGLLAGQIELSLIKADLKGDKLRQGIVDMLENVDKWDEAAHYRYGEPVPQVVEYKFERR